MNVRTPASFLFSTLTASLLFVVGCSSSSDDTSPTDSAPADSTPTDSASDSSGDVTVDALGNTCTPAGGTCVALTATSKCPDGTHTPSDPAIHCEGAGGMCCVPGGTDGGTDASGDAANACEAKGGTCIALTATSKCPSGSHSASDPCTGVGSMCCEPDTDAGDSGTKD